MNDYSRMSTSEPKWMNSISDDFVCNYFWSISAVIVIAGLITVSGFLYLLLTSSKNKTMLSLLIMQSSLTYGLVFLLYVCLYLLCSRTLLKKED